MSIQAPDRVVDGKAELLSEATRKTIDHWLTKFPEGLEGRRSAIIQSLYAAQVQNQGYLTPDLMDGVADYLNLPPVWVYEVASFYSMLETRPVGRHSVSICTNISCMLCGADKVVEHVENKLGIKMGETTEDGRIFLKIEEECVAACVGAPMMIVDGHYHENLTPEKIDEILDALD
ncbi:NADH-quinone oxidoreductase subunit NuoE family protein [Wenzhouxiangella marina]|uniref:NADH-quinone oxidoreductase subunit E n=1 Tax=Wenzhouxiangella marina TaxID=1579979 RepID=A0A0K0XTK2_9GAMM|nr:NAD(P)H-dependent oxidoreductase subunit E [Wenzhouxiangella marina]AKS40985.1 NADH dehydrogenase [Wenzhouxiangella marina]MBB6087859.1 NADH-quinone oxidoreductase subunit E [Wenzhouxiangella marina]